MGETTDFAPQSFRLVKPLKMKLMHFGELFSLWKSWPILGQILFHATHQTLCFLCSRWLRARKFVLSDTIRMVEEATVCRQEHADANFYENPKQALGVELSTYIAQYPQLYTGFTKTGCPLFISKPGVLCTGGLECITTISGILRYHWYEMIHNFGGALKESISINKNFKR